MTFLSAVRRGDMVVRAGGQGLPFDEDLAKKVLSERRGGDRMCHAADEGDHAATCWGCDLTYDYVKINGDYRT